MSWEHADLFAMKLSAWGRYIPEEEHVLLEAAVRFLFTAGSLFQQAIRSSERVLPLDYFRRSSIDPGWNEHV